MKATVSVISCKAYELEAVRLAVTACLEPLGGMRRFVHPGMRVLLKPNMLAAAEREQAVTTHPLVVQAVAELVSAAGGEVLIGDSPAAVSQTNQTIWRKSGMAETAEKTGASLILFDNPTWKSLDGQNYFIARSVLDADLVIDLPKLKTHMLTRYTGAVKNLYGTITGGHKREIHIRAPGVQDFSRELVNILQLVRPGLTLMDGILGQEGNGPGVGGTPHAYGCLAASTDPVALDVVIARGMGFRPGDVLHLAQAGARGLGTSDLGKIDVLGERSALEFGRLKLPAAHWYLRVPSWLSRPVRELTQLKPKVDTSICNGCGKCAQACPGGAITVASPAQIDLNRCIGCMCCAEVCPKGAMKPNPGRLARLAGMG